MMRTCFSNLLRLAAAGLCLAAGGVSNAAEVLTPVIQGDSWQVAGDPDLGEFTDPRQQPVDFGVWQAADGTWQLWSCIRHTRCGGKTRLFHRWEGAALTNAPWTPKGVALQADASVGETQGGLQAPYVFKDEGGYVLFYGDWNHICSATGADGKSFTRRAVASGRTGLFGEGADANARDPMVIRIGGLWHGYYTAHPNRQGAVFCRTSQDLRAWSDARIVAAGGRAGNGPYSAECPFVVEPRPGEFYLFRTQRYGRDAQTSVYRSDDPLNFGVNDDAGRFVCTLPVAAPEIFQHDGQWYLASLLPSLKGIRIARLAWEARAPAAAAPTRVDNQ